MSMLQPDEQLDRKTYVVAVVAFNAVLALMLHLVLSLLGWGGSR